MDSDIYALGDIYWSMPVIMYLFLGGVGAGAVIVSGHVYHLSRGMGFGGFAFNIARYGALIAPLLVIFGTGMIIWELTRPFRVGNLFKLINLSPMSIGSWLLFFFIILSVAYAIMFLPKSFGPDHKVDHYRKTLAWIIVPVAYGVAVYTGVMLGATPGRPFWNSSILPFLFLLSAISGGIASILLAMVLFHRKGGDPELESDYVNSSFPLLSWDNLVLALEMVSLFVFVIFAYLTVESATAAISLVLAGGAYAVQFWFGVVFLAIVLPLAIELPLIIPKLLYDKPFRTHVVLEVTAPVCILAGGFMLRYLVVIAGQVSHPVGI